MEKMSLIFFIIIVAYLLYALVMSRKELVKKRDVEIQTTKKNDLSSQQEKNKDVEKAAIAAVLAAFMGDTAYVLKRVYAVATVDENNSSWRYAGRNEMMTRKNTLK
jgi:uncharacterized membrane protein